MPEPLNIEDFYKAAHEQALEKNVATAFSLVVGLSDNSQITFQSGFEGDESDAVVNARIDRILRIAARQRAIGEIDQLERDLLKLRSTLSQYQEDLARIDGDGLRQIAQLKIELEERVKARDSERKAFQVQIDGDILKMQDMKQEVFNTGIEEHRRSGRAGSYLPKGHTKVNIERIESQIEKAKAHRDEALSGFDQDYEGRIKVAEGEIERVAAERDQALERASISIKRYQDEITIAEEKLAKARALAGG